MKIKHIALYVNDLERSAAFFETYFGGKRNRLYHNPNTGFSSYFISFDESSRLELMHISAASEMGAEPRLGYAHVAFALGSKEKVDDLTERLERDGYTVRSRPRTTGDGYYESSVYDPDGNVIEITE